MGEDPPPPQTLDPSGALRGPERREALRVRRGERCRVGTGPHRKIISQFELVNERNKLTKLIFQGILV